MCGCLVGLLWCGELLCYCYRILLPAESIVAATEDTCTAESVKEGVAAAALGRFGGVSSNML